VPEVEIEPLKVVPAGNSICNCESEETLKAGTTVADAERAVKGTIISAVNIVHINILVFFIFPHLKNDK